MNLLAEAQASHLLPVWPVVFESIRRLGIATEKTRGCRCADAEIRVRIV